MSEEAEKRKPMPQTKPPPRDADDNLWARWWRENILRVSQKRLAELLGLKRETVNRYESGTMMIPRTYRLACLGLEQSKWYLEYWPDRHKRK